MCGSKPKRDNSADIARQQEEARQRRITEGQGLIDSQFSGFNDDFYNNYQTQYLDYYTPQLSEQYDDARKRLTLALAQTGNLTSSAGANQFADLEKYYNTQSSSITNRAADAMNQLRINIDNKKSQLYSDNRAAADPGSASSAAASAAQALQPAAPTTPLANAFGDFFNNLGTVSAIQNRNRSYGDSTGVQNFNNSGSTSYKVYS